MSREQASQSKLKVEKWRVIVERYGQRSTRWRWTLEHFGYREWGLTRQGYAWSLQGARTKAFAAMWMQMDTVRAEMVYAVAKPQDEAPTPEARVSPCKPELLSEECA